MQSKRADNATNLAVKHGRVMDPARGIDAKLDVVIKDGHIQALVEPSEEYACPEIDASGKLVVPGLIDLHTHVYWGGSSISIRLEDHLIRSGVTTWVDAGSAGAGNFKAFKQYIIDPSPVRIMAFLNISFAGIFGCMNLESGDFESGWVGDLCDLRLANISEAVSMGEAYPQTIVGIKIRAGFSGCDQPGLEPVKIAKQAAEAIHKPLMVHIGFAPPTTGELLATLQKGDVLTHAFREDPNSMLNNSTVPLAELFDARERGVLLDIGHGAGSFSFTAANTLLSHGVQPDIISSDLHAVSVNGPAYDLPTTMSKMLMLGMPLKDVIHAVTARPASVLGLEQELGTLAPGTIADITVLDQESGSFEFQDCFGNVRKSDTRLKPTDLIFGGSVICRSGTSTLRSKN